MLDLSVQPGDSVGESHCKIIVAKDLNVEIIYKQDLVGPHECRSWALCLPCMQKHFLLFESLSKSTCPPSSSPLEPLRSKRGPNKSSGSLMPRSTNFLERGKAGKLWDLKICHELTSANRNPVGFLHVSVMYSYNDSKQQNCLCAVWYFSHAQPHDCTSEGPEWTCRALEATISGAHPAPALTQGIRKHEKTKTEAMFFFPFLTLIYREIDRKSEVLSSKFCNCSNWMRKNKELRKHRKTIGSKIWATKIIRTIRKINNLWGLMFSFSWIRRIRKTWKSKTILLFSNPTKWKNENLRPYLVYCSNFF